MSEPEVNANDTLFEAPPMGEQERMVEAILFASADPVSVKELNDRMPHRNICCSIWSDDIRCIDVLCGSCWIG